MGNLFLLQNIFFYQKINQTLSLYFYKKKVASSLSVKRNNTRVHDWYYTACTYVLTHNTMCLLRSVDVDTERDGCYELRGQDTTSRNGRTSQQTISSFLYGPVIRQEEIRRRGLSSRIVGSVHFCFLFSSFFFFSYIFLGVC